MSDYRVGFAQIARSFGVAITVTPKEGSPATTDGVWDASPPEEPQPVGMDLRKREPRRVLAVSRAGISVLNRGDTIAAPEYRGGPTLRWDVDGIQRVEWDCWRAIVKLKE